MAMEDKEGFQVEIGKVIDRMHGVTVMESETLKERCC